MNRGHPPQIRARSWGELARETPASAVVLLICAVLTAGRILGPDWLSDGVSDWFLGTGEQVWRGAWWTLITSTFLHADALHILFNGYWVWILGRAIELDLGVRKWVAFSLVAAFVSSALQMSWSGGQGIGYSGVVYGLVGLAWASPRLRRAHPIARANMVLFVGWGLLCIGFTLNGTLNVGNVAHFSGLAFGAGVGGSMGRERWRWAGPALLIAAALVVLVWCPWQPSWVLAQVD